MKAIFSISILVLFVYIQMFNGMVWMSYEINKSAIIQEFCENKDKPELQCEGTCHMKKMMLTEDNEEDGKPMMVIPEIELFVNHVGIDLINSEFTIKRLDDYSNLYSYCFLNDWEIPPRV